MTHDTSAPEITPAITEQAARYAVDASRTFDTDALAIARLSIYDWLAVGLAGADEPVSRAVRELVTRDSGTPAASAFGVAGRLPPRAAALLNGTASHALDYDDTHFAFVGHPSVAVLPAALALGEAQQVDGRALLEAFLTGVEVTCRVGAWLGRAHYNAGFHQTATSGTFGAAAAGARLLGLDATQAAHALGLAATRAAGLKCQFGTMAKPFHAGMAAANGVEAAMLASLGFLARPDAIECAGGFAATHGALPDDGAPPFADADRVYRFVDVQHKFHACCHGTHPALEALLALRDAHRLTPGDIAAVQLHINPQWLPVCCIETPRTGLEAKFSLALTAAMTLAGRATAALDTFSDALCADPELVELARRVTILGDVSIADTACRASVETKTGARVEHALDLSDPVPFDLKADKLRAKTVALVGAAKAEMLWHFVEALPGLRAQALYPALHALIAAPSA